MTEAQAAHLRLMEQLRERTLTHICSPEPRVNKRSPKARLGLRERLLKCQAAGMTRHQMAFECHTSSKTIVRLLGKVRFVCLRKK